MSRWYRIVVAIALLITVGYACWKLAIPADRIAIQSELTMLGDLDENPGKILIAFQPAGKMETFFQEAAKLHDFAADAKLYRDCDMDLIGPPLSLA